MFKSISKFMREYRHFFVAFILSLIVFGSMFAVTLYSVTSQRGKAAVVNKNQQNIPINDKYIPSVEDNLPLLLMLGKDSKAAPSTYLLVHWNATTNQCKVVELPALVRCTVGSRTKTLDGFYKFSGISGAVSAVSSLFSLPKCEYLRTDGIGIKNLADYFSGVRYDIKSPLRAENYNFKSGEQLLDGARISELMLSNNFNEKAQLLAEFFKEHLNRELSDSMESLYEIMFEQSQTSLNRASLMRYEVPAKLFLMSDFEKISAENLPGVERDGAFMPEYESIKKLKESFSKSAESGF